jgi:hypothetical protein
MIPLMWIIPFFRPEAETGFDARSGSGTTENARRAGRCRNGRGSSGKWGRFGILRTVIDHMHAVTPWFWLVLGMICIGFSMIAFAWVTWPDGFEGIWKTLVGLLTTAVPFG